APALFLPARRSDLRHAHPLPTRRSSDLEERAGQVLAKVVERRAEAGQRGRERSHRRLIAKADNCQIATRAPAKFGEPSIDAYGRSEEHTSNSSHGSLSSAVFCLRRNRSC